MKTEEIVLTVMFVAAVTALFSYLSYRQKQSSWKGELVDKDKRQDEDRPDTYHLKFRTDSGKTVKMQVGKAFYDQYAVGDRFEKSRGDYTPRKI